MPKNEAIDPAGEETVLFYVGPGVVPDVPARDLHGADIARIAYVRAHRATDWDQRDADGNGPPLPKAATAAQLAKLADELRDSDFYRRTDPTDAPTKAASPKRAASKKPAGVPRGNTDNPTPTITTTEEPAPPAEG